MLLAAALGGYYAYITGIKSEIELLCVLTATNALSVPTQTHAF